jgi:hypothetical protein
MFSFVMLGNLVDGLTDTRYDRNAWGDGGGPLR